MAEGRLPERVLRASCAARPQHRVATDEVRLVIGDPAVEPGHGGRIALRELARPNAEALFQPEAVHRIVADFGKPQAAVTVLEAHILQAQGPQISARVLEQLGDALDRIDFTGEARQDSSLIAAAGSYLENSPERFSAAYQLDHARNDIGTRNGLAEADRQSRLLVGAARQSLIDEAVSEKQLDALIGPVRAECDVIVLDTDASEPAVVGPMAIADHIVIPTGLDILSLRAAALTVGLAQQHNMLDHIRGIAVANVERPATRAEQSLLEGLSKSGLAFETVLWSSPEWTAVLAGGSEDPPAELLAESKKLLREVALRKTSVDALRQFVGLAHARSLAAV